MCADCHRETLLHIQLPLVDDKHLTLRRAPCLYCRHATSGSPDRNYHHTMKRIERFNQLSNIISYIQYDGTNWFMYAWLPFSCKHQATFMSLCWRSGIRGHGPRPLSVLFTDWLTLVTSNFPAGLAPQNLTPTTLPLGNLFPTGFLHV